MKPIGSVFFAPGFQQRELQQQPSEFSPFYQPQLVRGTVLYILLERELEDRLVGILFAGGVAEED
jgi:hypothetical protein